MTIDHLSGDHQASAAIKLDRRAAAQPVARVPGTVVRPPARRVQHRAVEIVLEDEPPPARGRFARGGGEDRRGHSDARGSVSVGGPDAEAVRAGGETVVGDRARAAPEARAVVSAGGPAAAHTESEHGTRPARAWRRRLEQYERRSRARSRDTHREPSSDQDAPRARTTHLEHPPAGALVTAGPAAQDDDRDGAPARACQPLAVQTEVMHTRPHRPLEAQADPSAGDRMDAQPRDARVRRVARPPRAHAQHAGHNNQHPSHHPLKHHRPAVRHTRAPGTSRRRSPRRRSPPASCHPSPDRRS